MAKEISEVLAEADGNHTVEVTLKASTKSKSEMGPDGKPLKTEEEFVARLPKDLKSAIAILGEKQVFGLFARALVVELQGEKRQALVPPEGKQRKRASYLETLGL